MTAADLVIQEFADAEAALYEQLALVEADRDAHRTLAEQAIHSLRELTCELDRLRDQHHRLLDECRTLREKTMRRAVAA